MNKTRAQLKRISRKQSIVYWARRNRFVLIVASVLVAVLSAFATGSMGHGNSIALFVLLLLLLVFACGVLAVAVAQMIELLKTISKELAMIRSLIDAELFAGIATDLTAVRTQMGKGILGLLGM